MLLTQCTATTLETQKSRTTRLVCRQGSPDSVLSLSRLSSGLDSSGKIREAKGIIISHRFLDSDYDVQFSCCGCHGRCRFNNTHTQTLDIHMPFVVIESYGFC